MARRTRTAPRWPGLTRRPPIQAQSSGYRAHVHRDENSRSGPAPGPRSISGGRAAAGSRAGSWPPPTPRSAWWSSGLRPRPARGRPSGSCRRRRTSPRGTWRRRQRCGRPGRPGVPASPAPTSPMSGPPNDQVARQGRLGRFGHRAGDAPVFHARSQRARLTFHYRSTKPFLDVCPVHVPNWARYVCSCRHRRVGHPEGS